MSLNRQMWIFCGILLLICGFFVDTSIGQSSANDNNNRPIVGAFRIYPRTSFQCTGRPAGYYADVESGCQVYHMCDGLGRQFSYSCPNTTLFQQRMLICDHWYMVNCSKAESNYAANLLIGQRDKPFVPEEENELRTPRPDLLDRPYAPDYAGESFRNQYKTNPPFQNTLDQVDFGKQNEKISLGKQTNKFDGHYSVPGHWSITNSAGFRSTTNGDIIQNVEEQNYRKVARRRHDESVSEVPEDTSDNQHAANTLDLGVSASQDSRRSEDESHFENSLPVESSTIKQIPISTTTTLRTTTQRRTFQPISPTTSFIRLTTSTPISTQRSTPTTTRASSTTAQDRIDYQPTAEEIESNSVKSSEDENASTLAYNNFDFLKVTTSEVEPTRRNESQTTQPKVEINNRSQPQKNTIQDAILIPPAIPATKPSNNRILPPPNDLLPPFETLRLYDDSTTQGPPIYYQWKIPASGLEPPEYTEKFIPKTPDYRNQNKTISPPSNRLLPPILSNETKAESKVQLQLPITELLPPHQTADQKDILSKFANNPFLSSAFSLSSNPTKQQKSNRSPTPRSISSSSAGVTSQPKKSTSTKVKDNNYLDLKKVLLIPDYTFPLEQDVSRGAYQAETAVNSFQIKIPKKPSDDDTPWYGENAKCPECHPSFLKPGSCEPCIKIR